MVDGTSSKAHAKRWAACAAAIALLLGIACPALADEPAKELASTLQKARSRMMGMQIDQAVDLFRQATALLESLQKEDPGHADLPGLKTKYDKLAGDMAKKVVQRAGRDVNPMKSALESALGAGDAARIAQARDKLAAAVEKHRANLLAAGGTAGAALLAGAEGALKRAAGGAAAPPPAAPGPEPAPTAPAAPGGDPKQIHDEIQRRFRSARSHDTPALVKAADEIRALIAQLRAADPNHPKIGEFSRKIDKMVADAYAKDVQNAQRDIDRRLSRIRFYLERNDEGERPQLARQREELADVLEKHRAALEAAGPEGKALIAKTEAAMKEADVQIGAALAGDALVNEWIAKLSVYHMGGEKDITPGINGAALYAKVKEWRAEAASTLEALAKVEFAGGKTPELVRAEDFVRDSMNRADYNLAYAVTSRAEAAKQKVQGIANMFAGDQAWRQDATKPPLRFADELLDAARLAIEELAGYVPDHAELPALRQEHARLRKENQERRDASKALTFLKADKYTGDDAASLKAFAAARVPKDHPGAKALRVTLFTPEWKEETVVEWTDTTHSALRVRTTRTLMFCVAFQDREGVFRDFGYLNQDRTADGGWGPVYGHLAKYRAPMLAENVEKDEPEGS